MDITWTNLGYEDIIIELNLWQYVWNVDTWTLDSQFVMSLGNVSANVGTYHVSSFPSSLKTSRSYFIKASIPDSSVPMPYTDGLIDGDPFTIEGRMYMFCLLDMKFFYIS